MNKYKNKLNNKIIITSITVLTVIVLGIVIYSLQFEIFKTLYNNNNSMAKQIYNLNSNNKEFNNRVSNLFSKKVEELIQEYKADNITFEELKNEANKFQDYKNYTEQIKMVKEQKEKLIKANQHFDNKEYQSALDIYIELNDNEYDTLVSKIDKTKQQLKIEILQQVEKLKNEKNYIKAIEKINNVKKYYSNDKEIKDLLSEIETLKVKQENEEKEKKKIKEIKSAIKVTRVWTASPNSAGGVDLFVNWKNLSSKVIKYAYFTVIPYNSVKDTVTCTIRDYSRFTAQDEGPYKKGQGTTGTYWRWENAWYNHSIRGAKLIEVRIEYMDGSSLDIPEKYIKYII